MKKAQLEKILSDISEMYSKDIGNAEKALESLLMSERSRKIGPFKTLPRKSQITTLNRSQLLHLYKTLMLDWMHFQTRCVVPLNRRVRRASFDPGKYKPIVDNVQEALENSQSLKDRVSRQILKRFKRNHLKQDPLLWHWGVHHFHLGEFDADLGYAKGTNDLLFVFADMNEAIILGIGEHDQIGEQWIFEKIFEISPELLEKYTIRGIRGPRGFPNTSPKQNWSKLNFMYQYKEHAIFPPGQGVTSSGHALRLVKSLDRLFHAVSLHDRSQPYGTKEINLASFSFNGSFVEVSLNNGKLLERIPLI